MLDSVLGFCLGGGVPVGQDSAYLWPAIASEVGVFMVAGLEVRAKEGVKRRETDNELQVKVGVKVKARAGVKTEAALGLPDAGWL